MTENYLEKSIIEQLPQLPYVVDQVGDALKWAKEELSEGEYNHALKVTHEVACYAKSISNPNFFKVHLVVASILSYIKEAIKNEKFQRFDSASKSVEKSLSKLVVSPEAIEKHGCFKSVLLNIVPLASENQELFTIALIGIKHDLLAITEGMEKASIKAPITPEDYISILGYAIVMANIRMANIKFLDSTYKVYNEIAVILNSINY